MEKPNPRMMNLNRGTHTSRLQLVSDHNHALGPGPLDVQGELKTPEHESWAWALFSAYGPAGRALHACEFADDCHFPVSATSPPINRVDPSLSLFAWLGSQIDRLRQSRERKRRIQEQISELQALPDYILRDIGLDRCQITEAVRAKNLKHAGAENDGSN